MGINYIVSYQFEVNTCEINRLVIRIFYSEILYKSSRKFTKVLIIYSNEQVNGSVQKCLLLINILKTAQISYEVINNAIKNLKTKWRPVQAKYKCCYFGRFPKSIDSSLWRHLGSNLVNVVIAKNCFGFILDRSEDSCGS